MLESGAWFWFKPLNGHGIPEGPNYSTEPTPFQLFVPALLRGISLARQCSSSMHIHGYLLPSYIRIIVVNTPSLLRGLLLDDGRSFDCPVLKKVKAFTALRLSVTVGILDRGICIRS